LYLSIVWNWKCKTARMQGVHAGDDDLKGGGSVQINILDYSRLRALPVQDGAVQL
jgi:hypothetical protein